jgi:hypothetical protein
MLGHHHPPIWAVLALSPCRLIENRGQPNHEQEVSNGAVFMPNTFFMQELARMYYDQYYADLVDEGKQVDKPYIYTVAKGKSKWNPP